MIKWLRRLLGLCVHEWRPYRIFSGSLKWEGEPVGCYCTTFMVCRKCGKITKHEKRRGKEEDPRQGVNNGKAQNKKRGGVPTQQ